MALHRVSTPKGFSLVEMLIVLGIVAAVGSLVLFADVHSVGKSSFRNEVLLLVVSLQKARSESIAGICLEESCIAAAMHGVHVTSTSLVLFEGAAYDANTITNVSVPLDKSGLKVAGLADAEFMTLTAAVAVPGTIILSDTAGDSATVTIGPDGQISWSN